MKGQYLAVETVFTFGLGLIVAIGVITLFHELRLGVMDNAEPSQAEMVSSEVILAMNSLKEVDEGGGQGSGSYDVSLPERIAGESYSISLGESVVVDVAGESYSRELTGFDSYTVSGSVQGGDVTVFKEENQFFVRAQ